MREHAGTRILSELLWSLRRGGLDISASQAIDCARAAALVGFESKRTLRDALGAIIVAHESDARTYERAFDRYFGAETAPRDVFDRLRARGLSEDDVAALMAILAEMARASADGASLLALTERGAELDRLLASTSVVRALESAHGPLQAGFVAHKVLGEVGHARAASGLGLVRARLVDALGAARADAIVKALKAELAEAENDVRGFVRDRLAPPAESAAGADVMMRSFSALSPEEVREVRRAVRKFVERLWGRESVRRRIRRRGRLDPHATIRRAMHTFGVPVVPVRKEKREDKPKLFLFADVSDSVRASARFLLELAYLARELFERTRTFAFVSDVVETTDLFAKEPIDRALARVWGGGMLSVRDNSNYGRVLSAIEQRFGGEIDRRTSVVILGDGRANYLQSGADALGRMKARARSVVWLCPERRSQWSTGDSRMAEYERASTHVFEMTNARELERAARALVTRRSS